MMAIGWHFQMGVGGAHLYFGIEPLRGGVVNPGFNGWIDPVSFLEY